MNKQSWYLSIVMVVFFGFIGCSRNIVSVGPFEGQWGGRLYWRIGTGSEYGTVSFTVNADHSLEGDGTIYHEGGPYTVPIFELLFSGEVNPNGAIDGKCHWKLVDPTEEKSEGKVDITGYFYSALDYGRGSMTLDRAQLYWIVTRR
jgi:hypothetical protein